MAIGTVFLQIFFFLDKTEEYFFSDFVIPTNMTYQFYVNEPEKLPQLIFEYSGLTSQGAKSLVILI